MFKTENIFNGKAYRNISLGVDNLPDNLLIQVLTAGWGKYVPDKPTDTEQNLMKLKSSYLPSQKCQPRVSPRKWHKSFLCTTPTKYAGWCHGIDMFYNFL